MNEDTIDNIEENIEDTPQEVTDFIFEGDFQAVKDELALNFSDKTQQLEIENNLELFLVGSLTFEELADSINNLSLPEEKKIIIKTIIQEKVLDELQLLIKVHQELDGEVSEQKSPEAQSSTNTLDRLNQSLVRPTTFASTKRTYSGHIVPVAPVPVMDSTSRALIPTPKENLPLEIPIKTTPAPTSTFPIERSGIDPYRELPNK